MPAPPYLPAHFLSMAIDCSQAVPRETFDKLADFSVGRVFR